MLTKHNTRGASTLGKALSFDNRNRKLRIMFLVKAVTKTVIGCLRRMKVAIFAVGD